MKLRLLSVVLCLVVFGCQTVTTMTLPQIGNDGTTIDFDNDGKNYKLICPKGADFQDGTPGGNKSVPELNCTGCEILYCSYSPERLSQGETRTKHGPAAVYNNKQRSKGYFNNNQREGVWVTELLKPVRLFEKKTFQAGKPKGSVIRYENGQPIFIGNLDGDQYVGSVKFMKPDGSVLAEGSYNQAKEQYDKYFSEEKNKQEQLSAVARKKEEQRQEHEEKKFAEDLKRYWSEKNQSEVRIYTDKRTKISWTEFMGSANWLNATLKCRKIGMRLPTSGQLQVAIENGLMSFIENPYRVVWTSEDKSSVVDMHLNEMMGNYDALAVTNDAQVFSQSKREDQGIICSR